MSRSTQPKLNPVGPSHTVVLHHHVRPSGPARAERRPPQRAETRRGTPDVEPAKGGPGRIYPSRRCSRRPRAVLPLQPRRRWPPPRGQYRESLAFSRGAAHEALPAKHPRTTAAAAAAGCGDGRGLCRGEFFCQDPRRTALGGLAAASISGQTDNNDGDGGSADT